MMALHANGKHKLSVKICVSTTGIQHQMLGYVFSVHLFALQKHLKKKKNEQFCRIFTDIEDFNRSKFSVSEFTTKNSQLGSSYHRLKNLSQLEKNRNQNVHRSGCNSQFVHNINCF